MKKNYRNKFAKTSKTFNREQIRAGETFQNSSKVPENFYLNQPDQITLAKHDLLLISQSDFQLNQEKKKSITSNKVKNNKVNIKKNCEDPDDFTQFEAWNQPQKPKKTITHQKVTSNLLLQNSQPYQLANQKQVVETNLQNSGNHESSQNLNNINQYFKNRRKNLKSAYDLRNYSGLTDNYALRSSLERITAMKQTFNLDFINKQCPKKIINIESDFSNVPKSDKSVRTVQQMTRKIWMGNTQKKPLHYSTLSKSKRRRLQMNYRSLQSTDHSNPYSYNAKKQSKNQKQIIINKNQIMFDDNLLEFSCKKISQNYARMSGSFVRGKPKKKQKEKQEKISRLKGHQKQKGNWQNPKTEVNQNNKKTQLKRVYRVECQSFLKKDISQIIKLIKQESISNPQTFNS